MVDDEHHNHQNNDGQPGLEFETHLANVVGDKPKNQAKDHM